MQTIVHYDREKYKEAVVLNLKRKRGGQKRSNQIPFTKVKTYK